MGRGISLYHFIPESNDIAIVTLKNEVPFNKASIPACLSKLEEPIENESAIVVGWGLTSFDGIQSRYLRRKIFVKSPILMHGSCTFRQAIKCWCLVAVFF